MLQVLAIIVKSVRDIATLVGAEIVSDQVGVTFEDLTLENLGTAKRVIVGKDSSTIIEGARNQESIESRTSHIRHQMENNPSDYEREKLQERLSKLVGGVAVIKLGAATETELKEKKARIEDALHATRAAEPEEGIVPGGGVTLLRAAKNMEADLNVSNAIQAMGRDIIRQAIEAPIRQISANASVDGSIVVQQVLQGEKWVWI